MSVLPQLDATKHYGDWRDDLARDGLAVVKGAVSRENAEKYRQGLFEFFERFQLGFDRNDASTWVPEKLPVLHLGGIINHSVAHEKFLWDLRQEPGVIDVYSKLWGTKDLLASFDGGNLALPGKMQDFKVEKWAHNDQSPFELGMRCVQGIVNLNDNGPDDGGLIVLKGSHKLFDKFFSEIWTMEDDYPPEGKMEGVHGYAYKPEGVKWFEDQGLKWEKVCVGAGDLILWDSRSVHYNVPPFGVRDRCCAYVCYEPPAAGNAEELKKKQAAFEQRLQSTHVPISYFSVKPANPVRNGKPCRIFNVKPFEEPELTSKLLKLAGMEPY